MKLEGRLDVLSTIWRVDSPMHPAPTFVLLWILPASLVLCVLFFPHSLWLWAASASVCILITIYANPLSLLVQQHFSQQWSLGSSFFQSHAGFLSLIIKNLIFVDLFLVALKNLPIFPYIRQLLLYCVCLQGSSFLYLFPHYVAKKDFSFSYVDKMKKARKLG